MIDIRSTFFCEENRVYYTSRCRESPKPSECHVHRANCASSCATPFRSLRVDYLPFRELVTPLQDFFHQETQLRSNPLSFLQHTNERTTIRLCLHHSTASFRPSLHARASTSSAWQPSLIYFHDVNRTPPFSSLINHNPPFL